MIDYESEDGISTIKINRPDCMNALNYPSLERLDQIVSTLLHDRKTRVVIITGVGEKAFCSGADLKERRSFTEAQVRQFIYLIREVFTKIEKIPKPVIAALNGVAFGGGMELALACDLRIAGKHVKMGLTETSLGIIPGAGGTQRLPRLIGKVKAKELIFTAAKISAEEAEKLGLVNYVVPKGEELAKAFELARKIKENAPLALSAAKFAIDQGLEVHLTAGLSLETKAYETLIPTKDRLEGLHAFQEKRKPRYQGE